MAEPAPEPVRVTVGVCTFRRPEQLGRLLDALAAQELDGVALRVLVVDNSPGGEGAAVCAARPDVEYVPLGAGNISVARNAVLDRCPDPLLAMIDDDEVPSPRWLASLLEVQRATGAPAVIGPVLARYADGAPAWLQRDDFYSVVGPSDGAELDEGISGNALLDLGAVRDLGLRFDEDLGLAGGEDQLFFRSLRARGGTLRFAAGAVAHEDVPAARTSVRYLLRREYRKGNTLGLLDRPPAHWPPGKPLRRAAAAAWWLLSGLLAVLRGAAGRSRGDAVAGALRVARALGMVSGLAGRRFEHYAPPPPVLAVVADTAPWFQAGGYETFLRGFLDHYRARGMRVVLLLTGPRTGFVVSRVGRRGVEHRAPGLRRVGPFEVLVAPRALAVHVAWQVFLRSPHVVQRLADRVRSRARAQDHHLGAPLDPGATRWLQAQVHALQPTVVMYSTVWQVPDGLELPASVQSAVVLTSDVMHQRAAALRERGYRVTPEGFTEADEARLLAQVPLLVAIQWDDAEELRRMVPTSTVVVAPIASGPRSPGGPAVPGRVLFVGSGSLHNVDGIRWFLDACWPAVRAAVPAAELHVVGTVCARLPAGVPGVVLRGEVEDLGAVHQEASVVVVPLRAGSGLKVKLVDAIRQERPVVTTSVGAQGLMALEPRPFAVEDEAGGLAARVVELLGDAGAREALEKAAGAVSARFSPEEAFAELDAHLRGAGVALPSAPGAGTTAPSPVTGWSA